MPEDSVMKSLEDKVLVVLKQHPQGLSDLDITKLLQTDVKPLFRTEIYNRLLKKGRLRLAQRFGATKAERPIVLYQWVDAKEAEKFKGLDASDRLVYDLVQNGGQNGVTKRDIKAKSNIQNTTELKQIVERLISRGLIKEIKSVQGTNKRVYIISELEPSILHTGGPWYNDDKEFDIEFINAIYIQVLAFTGNSAYVTVEQVTSYVCEIKLSNEPLSQNDIKSLMTTMMYDGVIEHCEGKGDGVEYYRKTQLTPAVNHLASIPCGSCPVFHDCVPGGVISPQTCVYMGEWLKQTADW